MKTEIGLVPDTSILVYYVFGNLNQKNRIVDMFQKSNNIIILNEILLSEIGRVIFASFFKFKEMIDNFLSKEENLEPDDFWITLTQKINRIWSSHLSRRLIYILTYFRNIYERAPLDKKDSKYYLKAKDRINSSIYLLIEELLEFQEELSKWKVKNTLACPQARWKIVYNEKIVDYEFRYHSKCSKICPNRKIILVDLIKEHKMLFLDILKNGKQFSNHSKITIDNKLRKTIEKLILISDKKLDFDFRTKYCYNLGDLLICLLLKGTDYSLYTMNMNHSKFILHFLHIDWDRLIEFTQL